jgi:hypothetical protein
MPKSFLICQFILNNVLDPLVLLPMLGFAWSRIRGGFERPRWIGPFVMVVAFDLLQGIVFTAMAYRHLNNQWFRHVFDPLVFLGILWILFLTQPSSRRRRWQYFSCGAVGIVAAVVGFSLNTMHFRNALFTSVMSLAFLTFCTFELRRMLLLDDAIPLERQPVFWLYTGLLILGSGTLIFNAISNYFLHVLPKSLILIPWVVMSCVYSIHYVFIAKVFLCRNPTSS